MVSIIVPVYNSEVYIDECITSVINQTFTDWELLLIDDCSNDLSQNIICKYCKLDPRIKSYFFNENVGAGVVRNKGIERATRKYIAFLDSDDYWHKNKLKMQLDFMENNNIDFSFTYFFELDKNDITGKIISPPKEVSSFSLLFNNYIKTLTAIYNSENIGKIYMPEYRKRQDWGLWFNILNKTKKAYCLRVPLAYYRTSNASLSKNKLVLVRENFNFYRNFLQVNYFTSIIMMICFLVVHFFYKTFCNRSNIIL